MPPCRATPAMGSQRSGRDPKSSECRTTEATSNADRWPSERLDAERAPSKRPSNQNRTPVIRTTRKGTRHARMRHCMTRTKRRFRDPEAFSFMSRHSPRCTWRGFCRKSRASMPCRFTPRREIRLRMRCLAAPFFLAPSHAHQEDPESSCKESLAFTSRTVANTKQQRNPAMDTSPAMTRSWQSAPPAPPVFR